MTCSSVIVIRDATASWARDLDVSLVSADDALAAVEHLHAIESMIAAAKMVLAARAVESEQWRARGYASAGHWLAAVSGTTAHVACERIACGNRLLKLDATREAALDGTLSVEQLTVIANAATAKPEREAELLRSAAHDSVSELRDLCLRVKAAADPSPDKTYARLRAARHVRSWIDREGAYNLRLRTTVDEGALIDRELDRLTDREFKRARSEGRHESHENYRADALSAMAGRSRAADELSAVGKKRPVPIRYLAVIRADLAPLVRGEVSDGELCEIAGLGPIPVALARDLLGESLLRLVLTNGQDANITHVGRGANAAQKIALLWRTSTCEVQGCSRRARLEADHIEEFHRTKHTTLQELRRMCDHHHRLKTTRGWEVIDGRGPQPMVPPDDPRHPRFPSNSNRPAQGAA